MFRFTGRFHKLKIDVDRFVREMNREMKRVMKEANAEFILAVSEKVPVFSGMAMASLRPFARAVGVDLNIEPDPNWTAHRYPDRSIALGEAAGRRQFEIESDNRHVYTRLNVTVEHFETNEFTPGMENILPLRNPTPWSSFQAGRDAWKQYMRANLKKRVPKVGQFILRTEVIQVGQ